MPKYNKQAPKSKHWCFTINNSTEADGELLAEAFSTMSYIVIGKEVGEDGTPHMQGYCVMNNLRRLTAMKKIMPRAHLEIKSKNSTYAECITYCKKDGDFCEQGTPPVTNSQRMKRKWEEAFLAAQEGRIEDIPVAMRIQHYHAFKRIKQDYPQKLPHLVTPCGEWWWGDTETGKTRKAWETYPNLYPKPKNKWWDGYNGEQVVLVDDVLRKDAEWIHPFLMAWADCYRYPAEQKGTTVQIRPTRIIVTSNFSIEDVFAEVADVTLKAIQRRYKQIKFT